MTTLYHQHSSANASASDMADTIPPAMLVDSFVRRDRHSVDMERRHRAALSAPVDTSQEAPPGPLCPRHRADHGHLIQENQERRRRGQRNRRPKRQPLETETMLMPLCRTCYWAQAGRYGDRVVPPGIDDCCCATGIVQSACVYCELSSSQQRKRAAVQARTAPTGELMCACGSPGGLVGPGKLELVRQCHGCGNLVTAPFWNFAGKRVVFWPKTPHVASDLDAEMLLQQARQDEEAHRRGPLAPSPGPPTGPTNPHPPLPPAPRRVRPPPQIPQPYPPPQAASPPPASQPFPSPPPAPVPHEPIPPVTDPGDTGIDFHLELDELFAAFTSAPHTPPPPSTLACPPGPEPGATHVMLRDLQRRGTPPPPPPPPLGPAPPIALLNRIQLDPRRSAEPLATPARLAAFLAECGLPAPQIRAVVEYAEGPGWDLQATVAGDTALLAALALGM